MSITIDLRKEGRTPLLSSNFQNRFLSLPNPDPVLRSMFKRDAYEDVLGDGRIASLVEQRIAGIVNKEYIISCDDEKVKDLIVSWLDSLDWSQIINDVWQAVWYGFVPMEVLWDCDKNTKALLPSVIRRRNFNEFHFNNKNELIHKVLGSETNVSQGVWAYKIFPVARNATYDNPYGKPLASKLFWMVAFKRAGFEFWVQMCENFANKAMNPIVTAKYRTGASDDEKNQVLEAAQRLQDSGSAAFPDGTDIDMKPISSSSSGADSNEPLINLCNEEIAITIMGHNSAAESTAGKLGSEDMGITVRGDLIKADAELVSGFLQKLINKIREINGISLPIKIELRDPKDEQAETKVKIERDSRLHQIGVRFKKQYFINNYGLHEDEIEILTQSPMLYTSPKQEATGVSAQVYDYASIAQPTKIHKPKQECLPPLADTLFDDAVLTLENIAATCQSYSEFQARAFAILEISDVEEYLSQSLLLANLKGRENEK